MDYDLILIRYGELSLKSRYVRNQFELTLVRNIKNAFKSNNLKCEISRERGRIYLYTNETLKGLDVLKRVFGITSFSPTVKTTSDINQIASLAIKISQEILNKEKSFAIRVTRTGNHDFSSQDVAVKIGNAIVKATKATVNLTKPDFELFIEIRNDNAFLFTEKIRGTGGLPFGTQGKTLALIDSSQSILAAWYIMRRGCKILFVNTGKSNTDTLNSFITNWHVDSDIRIVDAKGTKLYETLNKIACEKTCDAIVTGHVLYDNPQYELSDIKLLKRLTKLPILHPLIAMEEGEIHKKCKEIEIQT